MISKQKLLKRGSDSDSGSTIGDVLNELSIHYINYIYFKNEYSQSALSINSVKRLEYSKILSYDWTTSLLITCFFVNNRMYCKMVTHNFSSVMYFINLEQSNKICINSTMMFFFLLLLIVFVNQNIYPLYHKSIYTILKFISIVLKVINS